MPAPFESRLSLDERLWVEHVEAATAGHLHGKSGRLNLFARSRHVAGTRMQYRVRDPTVVTSDKF